MVRWRSCIRIPFMQLLPTISDKEQESKYPVLSSRAGLHHHTHLTCISSLTLSTVNIITCFSLSNHTTHLTLIALSTTFPYHITTTLFLHATQATALDSSGHHTFVSRYIHPQSPPVQLCPTGDANPRQAMVCTTSLEYCGSVSAVWPLCDVFL